MHIALIQNMPQEQRVGELFDEAVRGPPLAVLLQLEYSTIEVRVRRRQDHRQGRLRIPNVNSDRQCSGFARRIVCPHVVSARKERTGRENRDRSPAFEKLKLQDFPPLGVSVFEPYP